MSDFEVTLKMWNDLVAAHNRLVDRIKELENLSLPRTVKIKVEERYPDELHDPRVKKS